MPDASLAQFLLGQEVVPVVNITLSSGEVIETAGISGTIVKQEFKYSTAESDLLFYRHQVNLYEEVYVASGSPPNSKFTLFWFSDGELGGIDPNSGMLKVNVPVELDKYTVGNQKVNYSRYQINNILSQVSSSSPYYDLIESNLGVIDRHLVAMDRFSTTFGTVETIEGHGKAAGKQGENLGFDADVFLEMSENALGYYDVISQIEGELSRINEQLDVQKKSAAEDDEANFKVYYEQYTMGGGNENLFVPDGQNNLTNKPTSTSTVESTTLTDLLVSLSGLLNNLSLPTGRD